jgi:hypothetical protein
MILITHIFFALITVAIATYNLFTPTAYKLKVTYLLLAGTIISAVALIFTRHVDLGHACLTGIAYVGLVSAGVVLTKRRLATREP